MVAELAAGDEAEAGRRRLGRIPPRRPEEARELHRPLLPPPLRRRSRREKRPAADVGVRHGDDEDDWGVQGVGVLMRTFGVELLSGCNNYLLNSDEYNSVKKKRHTLAINMCVHS